LALVADALALVGLRGTPLADVGGDLADELLGDPAHHDPRGLRHLELDAVGGLDGDRVGVPERELEVPALELRAVADALDLQVLLEAVGDALDHVGDERARQAVQRTVLAAVGRALDEELLTVLLDADVARDALEELALRAVDADELGLDRDGHAGRDGDGLAADAGHRGPTRPAPRPRRRRPPRGPRGRS